MKSSSTRSPFTNWIFVSIFLILGIFNLILIDPIPGVFYLLLAFIYLPSTNMWIQTKFGFKIPFVLKIIVFLFVIWATMAVGDLFELVE